MLTTNFPVVWPAPLSFSPRRETTVEPNNVPTLAPMKATRKPLAPVYRMWTAAMTKIGEIASGMGRELARTHAPGRWGLPFGEAAGNSLPNGDECRHREGRRDGCGGSWI